MKKLMILGASYSLIPLINAAKKCGYYTIVTSIPGDYPGFQLADEISYTDITNPEAVLQAAKKYNVDGVATCCMDVGLRSLGYVNTGCNLTGPSWETVQKCTNKLKMKEAFLKYGVHTAKFCKIYSEEDLEKGCSELSFPLIIKAVDQMGSRGIFRCNNKEEVKYYYPHTMQATQKEYCILEEFLEGTMFGVEAMVEGGKLAYCLPVGNDLHQANPPFPIGHYVPWENDENLENKVFAEIQKAIEALGADNCPMDFDMMLKGDDIYIIEATTRAGATCLAELVSIHFGIDYYEAIAKLAMGESVKEYFSKKKEDRTSCITRLLEADCAGRVKSISCDNSVEGMFDCSFNIKEGDSIRLMQNGRDRIGQVIMSGRTIDECRERLNRVLDSIVLEVEND